MLDYSDKCFIFYLNLFDCHLLFTNASKFEGDCKYVQLWIFTHLTVFRFNWSFIRLLLTDKWGDRNFIKHRTLNPDCSSSVDVTYDMVSETSFCGYSTLKFYNSLCASSLLLPSFFKELQRVSVNYTFFTCERKTFMSPMGLLMLWWIIKLTFSINIKTRGSVFWYNDM